MWHVIGVKLISGRLHWQYFEDKDRQTNEGIKIQIRFISYLPPHLRRIVENIEKVMAKNNVAWLRTGERGREWTIDTQKLTEAFPELHACGWLRGKVSLPIELESEEKTVLGQTRHEGVIACYMFPAHFRFSLDDIYQSLWVLECEETFKQGTAFMLEDVGLITCQHVLGTSTHAFKATNYLRKYPVKVIAQDHAIDLAILHIDQTQLTGLDARTAPELEWNEHIFVAGFPNFKLGATPHVVEGRVVGFRNVSGIRRAMLSTPIIFGMSGGPVIDINNKVVGVAVTGSGTMEDSVHTENHGVIPIGSLRYLTTDKRGLPRENLQL